MHYIIVIEKMERTSVVVKRKIPHLTGLGCKLQYHLFFRVQVQLQSVCFMHPFIAEYMIQVTVCVYQLNRSEAVVSDKISQLFLFSREVTAGVHNYSFL